MCSSTTARLRHRRANGRLFPNTDYPAYTPLYNELKSLSNKYGVGVDAIILHFCSAKLKGAIVLSGADKPAYLEQNLKAAGFELSPQELESLAKFKTDPQLYWEERKKLTWD